MTWHVCWLRQPYVPDRPFRETWTVDREEFTEPGLAISSITLRLGVAVLGKEEDDDTWRVTNARGETIACVRKTPDDGPDPRPGQVPDPGKNGLGPLRRFRGLTWVGWLNYLVLRWFLLRLIYTVEEDNSISRYQLKICKTWRWS